MPAALVAGAAVAALAGTSAAAAPADDAGATTHSVSGPDGQLVPEEFPDVPRGPHSVLPVRESEGRGRVTVRLSHRVGASTGG
ncbi:hypothetical protein [Streptomyces sp. NPDC059949]|uniref:hypothetical protein n=1 Tax=Streptomyces sp. NPDC059949 TaxID=3347013 RepID=UPI003667A8D0